MTRGSVACNIFRNNVCISVIWVGVIAICCDASLLHHGKKGEPGELGEHQLVHKLPYMGLKVNQVNQFFTHRLPYTGRKVSKVSKVSKVNQFFVHRRPY